MKNNAYFYVLVVILFSMQTQASSVLQSIQRLFTPDVTAIDLMTAVQNNDFELVQKLLNNLKLLGTVQSVINTKDESGETALTLAIKKVLADFRDLIKWDDVQQICRIVKLLLGAGADPNVLDNTGNTPLMLVTGNNGVNTYSLRFPFSKENEQRVMIEQLLAAGADINAQNKNGDTALMIGLRIGWTLPVRTLLDAGALVNIRNQRNETAIDFVNHTANRNFLISIFDRQENERKQKEAQELKALAALNDLGARRNALFTANVAAMLGLEL